MTGPTWRSAVVVIGVMALIVGLSQAAPPADKAPAPADKTGAQVAEQKAVTTSPGDADPVNEWRNRTKKPLSWLEWGFDMRLREVYGPNLIWNTTGRRSAANNRYDADWHFQRYRFRAWTKVTPIENLDLNFRMTYEPRHYCLPATKSDSVANEGMVDILNFKWSKMFGLPMSVTVGRQDLILGNGWLVLDSSPMDGSRTISFDAARLTFDMESAKTRFDVIYTENSHDGQWWLDTACDKHFFLAEEDSRGVILYATNKSLPNTQIEPYFIYKHDRNRHVGSHGPTNALGHDADTFALGARALHQFNDQWKARGEFAQEFGNRDAATICAFGFNGSVIYSLKDAINSEVSMDYEYLSGDNPNSPKNEAFDLLWGRWPRWSELYIYTVIPEQWGRVADITNLHRIGFGYTCKPAKQLEFAAYYHLMFANHPLSGGRGNTSLEGRFRGQLLTALMKYKFTEWLSGHLLAEFFFPGGFYTDVRNDPSAFLRYELVFTW